jgi:hypothetical protein
LVGLQPDIIVTWGTPATIALQLEATTIPIVFAGVTDPVAQHIVPRLDRPSGNITGFARPRRDRPSRRRAAEKRDEVTAPDHSITSSAMASKVGGISIPKIFAVC